MTLRAVPRAGALTAAAVALVLVSVLVTTSITRSGDGAAAPPTRLRIAVVGDDYSAGSRNREVWPTLMAERTGWTVSNFALPGSGYVADGSGGHAFTYQVDRARASRPDIILIVGGLEDTGLAAPESTGSESAGPVTVGAADAIRKVVLGGERPLVVGPTWYESPVPAAVTWVSDEVQSATKALGVPYLDASNPPWLTSDLMQPDMSGPTDEGQSLLADKITDWIRSVAHQ